MNTEIALKSNDNKLGEKVILPLPPQSDYSSSEMEVYARFMRHLRIVPNSRLEIKILSAIQFTADMLDMGDEFVSKVLVDQGLRCPRQSFPSSYLEFVDKSLMRSGFTVGAPSVAAIELRKFWDKIGEDKFAAYQYKFDVVSETAFIET